ncbi:MAG: aspartyl/asparaginyl beta-hydroxylase domain-containing protein [Bacteroidia bacterium]|nr:aspartyl/asparaginyl beta-hydroxylase domain-containing protein [Bacteroidia bacterium]
MAKVRENARYSEWTPTVFIRPIEYSSQLPFFYPPEDFPELRVLSENWKEIRDEILRVEQEQGKLKGHKTYNTPPISSDENWSNFYLDNFLWRSHRNRKMFPVTSSIVDKIPNCSLASISILSPGGYVSPHYGDTDGIVRCHLGLVIPEEYPVCGIRVGGEERGWKEGELLVFTEAHLHEVWNRSNQRRYILIVDIVPGFMKTNLYKLCSQVLGALSYIFIERKFSIFRKLPMSFARFFHRVLSLLWRIYLPLQRALKLP